MKKISIALAAILLVSFTACVTYLVTFTTLYKQYKNGSGYTSTDDSGDFSKFLKTIEQYNNLYIREDSLDLDEINDKLIEYYLSLTGDKYSAYYTNEELQELMNSMNGKVVGIGVVIAQDYENKCMVILSLAENGPAAKAGLKIGDAIVAVQTELGQTPISDIGFSIATSYIKGEAGTSVTMTVERTEDGKKISRQVTVVREEVVVSNVLSRVFSEDASIGIIRIMEFNNTTANDFKNAADSLLASGCNKLVVDVRGNPGGLLTSIEAVLDMILPEGPVVRTIDKAGNDQVIYYADSYAPYQNVPIAVLVDGSTASAAELFASALKDYAQVGKLKATIVGVQTYGKGSMQTIDYLSNGSAIKVTNYLYCPPFSDNYDGIGVTPDIVVELDSSIGNKNIYLLPDTSDNQLMAAVEALRK